MENLSFSKDENIYPHQNNFNIPNNTNNDYKFNLQYKNILTGKVEATYKIPNSFQTKLIHTIGVLVDSYIILVPKHKFTSQIFSNPTLSFKFIPIENKFKNDFSNSFQIDDILSNKNVDEMIKENLSQLSSKVLFSYNDLFEDNLNEIEVKWALIVLQNPIGELLLEFNQLDPTYFTIEDNLIINKRNKLFFSTFNEEFEPYQLSIQNKIIFLNQKLYLLVTNTFVLNDGFVFNNDLKILGIYEQGISKILDVSQIKTLLEKENSKNVFLTFDNLLKLHLITFKESELKFVEIEILKEKDYFGLKVSMEHLKRIFFNEIGSLTFNLNYFNTFKDYFNSYDKIQTLFVAGSVLINKLSQIFKLNSKTLDKYLLLKRLINNENNEKYNIENLEIIGYNLELFQFKTLLDSFYFSKNLTHLDFSENIINLDKSKILSNFLYGNRYIKRLILRKTGMGYLELFYIIDSIKQGLNESLNLLNISDNNFYENHLRNFKFYENNDELKFLKLKIPQDLSILENLLKIKSLTNLFMYKINFKNQDEIINIFNKFKKVRLSELEIELENEKILKLENYDNNKIYKIAKNIKINGLRILNLSNNSIRKDAVKSIGEYLFIEESIEEIYLSNCVIEDNSTGIIFEFLIQKIKSLDTIDKFNLKILDLSNNNITWKGAEKIKEFLLNLSENKINKSLELENTEKDNFKLARLTGVFSNAFDTGNIDKNYNSKQFYLYLNDNTKFSEGVSKICEGISINSPVLNLYFNNVGLKSVDLDAIYNVIICGFPIRTLAIANNNLNDSHLEIHKLSKAFSFYKSNLELLYLQLNKISILGVYSIVRNLEEKIKKLKIICDKFDFSNINKEVNVIEEGKKLLNHGHRYNNDKDEFKYLKICFKYVEFFNKK